MPTIIARRTAQEKRLLELEGDMDKIRQDVDEVQKLAVRTALTVNKAAGTVNKAAVLLLLLILGLGTEKAQDILRVLVQIFK